MIDANPTTRVFLVDDHELIRDGLRRRIEAEPDLEVVGEAATAQEALERILAALPDVVIMDVSLPDGDGVHVGREIRERSPAVRLLMLSAYQSDEALFNSVIAGASGYLLKEAKTDELVSAIRTVATGGSLMEPLVSRLLENRVSREAQVRGPLSLLTPQERRILDLIAEGLTNREIAQAIFLSEKTVRNYVSSLLSKLGLRHRTQAALLAIQLRQSAK